MLPRFDLGWMSLFSKYISNCSMRVSNCSISSNKFKTQSSKHLLAPLFKHIQESNQTFWATKLLIKYIQEKQTHLEISIFPCVRIFQHKQRRRSVCKSAHEARSNESNAKTRCQQPDEKQCEEICRYRPKIKVCDDDLQWLPVQPLMPSSRSCAWPALQIA